MGFLDKKKEKLAETIAEPTIVVQDPAQAKSIGVSEAEPVEEVKEEPKRRIQVVRELPTQVVKEYVEDDGTIVEFKLIEEALSEIMNS